MRALRGSGPDRSLLERFYREVYLDAFGAQREPLEAWLDALEGRAPYRLTVQVALDDTGAILGGVCAEHYPRSACGLVTYMVVAPAMRRCGLGKRWLAEATAGLRAAGARAVFGEVNDPRVARAAESADHAWVRLERNQRWGARVVATRYVQPALGDGLERDRGLVLIALDEARAELPGALVRGFVEELFEANERRAPDAEVRAVLDGIPDPVPLVQLSR